MLYDSIVSSVSLRSSYNNKLFYKYSPVRVGSGAVHEKVAVLRKLLLNPAQPELRITVVVLEPGPTKKNQFDFREPAKI